MVVKKKKKTKKSKASAEDKPKDEEDDKPKIVIPEYLDPRKHSPMCTLNIQLLCPQWNYFGKRLFKLNFIVWPFKVMVTTPLFRVEEEIKKRHGGSMGEIQMCFNAF